MRVSVSVAHRDGAEQRATSTRPAATGDERRRLPWRRHRRGAAVPGSGHPGAGHALRPEVSRRFRVGTPTPNASRVESAALAGQPIITVKSGDVVARDRGPLIDYSSRSYALLPDGTSAPTVTPGTLPTTVTNAAANEVTVASINLRRFFDTVDDPGYADTGADSPGLRQASREGVARDPQAPAQPRHHRRAGSGERSAALNDLAARIAVGRRTGTTARYLLEGNDGARPGCGLSGQDVISVPGGVPRVSVTSVTQIGAGGDVDRSRGQPAGAPQRSAAARARGDGEPHVDRELPDRGRRSPICCR